MEWLWIIFWGIVLVAPFMWNQLNGRQLIVGRERQRVQAEQNIQRFERSLRHRVDEYRVFQTERPNPWLETEFHSTKQRILNSYGVNSDGVPHFIKLPDWHVDEDEKHIYVNLVGEGEDPYDIDWGYRLHHEDWVSKPSTRNRNIEFEHQRRRRESRGAKWWQFWKISKFK